MKKLRKNLLPQTIVTVAVLLSVAWFGFSLMSIEDNAETSCFNTIEETTMQGSDMFNRALMHSNEQLMLFSNIVATSTSDLDELLPTYMKHFCDTQNFSMVYIHWRDGRTASYGDYPHHEIGSGSFDEEIARMPYISDAHSVGDKRSEKYICLAVPIASEGDTVGALYGYISLDTFPSFITSTVFDGRCQFYIVDGNTGDFLMDEYHRYGTDGEEIPLSNLFDGSMGARESKPGYNMENMKHGIANGKSGYHIFKSQRTGEWYYTYYMPMGINNWSMQLTIDEPTAFSASNDVRSTVLKLMVGTVILALVILATLHWQNRKRRKQDAAELHKADYLNAVQNALITAHNNPNFVDQALRLLVEEIKAEKAILLTFNDNVVSDIYYWPSLDMSKAKVLIGVNIREEFPVMYDALASNESFFCDVEQIANRFTPMAKALFNSLSVFNILLVPISDNTGVLRGAIATLNMNGDVRKPDMLELVARDFFMAISNLESYNIIKTMGAIDYLTGIKNRNSFEAEKPGFETIEADNLWCIYIDVNGLHELNNTKGHAAGDKMLSTVSATVKKIFGMEHSYRLGGDEFVAFRTNSSHDELMSCKHRLIDELEKQGYFVSVGFEGTVKNENRIFDVSKIMAEAETIMYREKQKYYSENGISTERKRSLPDY